MLWDMVKIHLHHCNITEISLRNGTIQDCAGCPYKMCMHFSAKSSCYYGGVIVEQGNPHELIHNPKEARTKAFLSRFQQSE